MDEEMIRKEFEEWRENSWCIRDETGEYRDVFTQEAFDAWLESARRADRKAREECERIALQYSQAYGQMDDAMAVARDIRATIKEE